MSDLAGNQNVGFLMTQLILFFQISRNKFYNEPKQKEQKISLIYSGAEYNEKLYMVNLSQKKSFPTEYYKYSHMTSISAKLCTSKSDAVVCLKDFVSSYA